MRFDPSTFQKTFEALAIAAIISAYDVLAGLVGMLLCLLVRSRIKLNDSILVRPKQFWKWLTVSVCLDALLIFATVTGTLILIAPAAMSTLAAFLQISRITFLFTASISFVRILILVGIWIGEGVIGFRK